MKRSSSLLAWCVIVAAVAAAAVDVIRLYPRLPQQVASHFDAQGNPNGWSDKQSFVAVLGGVLAFIPLLGVVAASMIRHGPRSLLNVPHKDYWLAPEREAATRADLSQACTWIMASSTVFLAFITHDTLEANLHKPPHLESMWLSTGVLLTIVGLLALRMTLRYRRPPDS